MTKPSKKVVFLGGTCSGKTKLIDALKGDVWRDDYLPTEGFNFCGHEAEMTNWQFMDTTNKVTMIDLNPIALRGADVVVIALDLSKPMPFDSIDKYLGYVNDVLGRNFKGCILVGCKSDAQDAAIDQFNHYVLPAGFQAKKYLTSAKEKQGLESLLVGFSEVALETQINDQEEAQVKARAETQAIAKQCLTDAITNFLSKAQTTLPLAKYNRLNVATVELETLLNQSDISSDAKTLAVDKYKRESKQIIGEHSPLMKGLTIVVIVALTGILAAGIGFGIGFAAGLWTGPGAFLTGLLNGSGFAVGVMAMTSVAMTGALVGTSYSAFFKPNPLKPMLNAVVHEAAYCF